MWYVVAIHSGFALSRTPDAFHPLSFSEAQEMADRLNDRSVEEAIVSGKGPNRTERSPLLDAALVTLGWVAGLMFGLWG